jgi:hypothetical protein
MTANFCISNCVDSYLFSFFDALRLLRRYMSESKMIMLQLYSRHKHADASKHHEPSSPPMQNEVFTEDYSNDTRLQSFENASEVRETAKSVPIERINGRNRRPLFRASTKPYQALRTRVHLRDCCIHREPSRPESCRIRCPNYAKRARILRIEHVGSNFLDPEQKVPWGVEDKLC